MKKHPILEGLIAALLILSSSHVFAQAEPAAENDSEIQGVEKELEKKGGDSDVIAPVKLAPLKVSPTVAFPETIRNKTSSDTIIIQKNYMPKTERMQVFGGLTLAPNDVFYKTMGLQFRAAYHFSEKWGAEFVGLFLSSSKSAELRALEDKQGYGAQTMVSPRSYLGLDAYFNSMYGKAALNDRQIIPFEIYQTIGFGKMNTAVSNNATAVHFGLGQMFSISRSDALRIDLSLIIYQSKDINQLTQLTNTLLLTVGYGRFFPEAQYR